MDLRHLVATLRSSPSLQKKVNLHDVLAKIDPRVNEEIEIHASVGQDAAAVSLDQENGMWLLVATDSIDQGFLLKDPRAAGYSSVLVGVDDIYACGGKPLAVSINLGAPTRDMVLEVMDGIMEGSRQLRVPVVRGHTSITAPGAPFLSSTVNGTIDKDQYVSAGGARPGDLAVLAWDQEGRRSPNGPFWDTVTFKTSNEVLQRRAFMQSVAEKGLASAAKDVSDAGIIGTLYMMANLSRVGVSLGLGALRLAFKTSKLDDLAWFCTAFLTSAFLLAVPPGNESGVATLASQHGMTAVTAGTFDQGSVVSIRDDTLAVHEVIDWKEKPFLPMGQLK